MFSASRSFTHTHLKFKHTLSMIQFYNSGLWADKSSSNNLIIENWL